MDITSGIAKASMDLAAARVTSEAQTAVLKNVMDAQKETMAILLQSMGLGGNFSTQA